MSTYTYIHIYIKIYYHIHSCLHSSIAFFCICPAHCLFTLWWSAITAPAELRWDAIQRLRQRAVGSHREKMCFGVPWVVSAVWCFIDASCLICAFDVHLTYLFYLIFCPCPWSVVQHCPALPSIAVMLFTSHPLEAWLARWFVWTWGAKICQKNRSLKLIIILPSKLCFFGVHPIFRQSHILGMPTESHPPRNPSAN